LAGLLDALEEPLLDDELDELSDFAAPAFESDVDSDFEPDVDSDLDSDFASDVDSDLDSAALDFAVDAARLSVL
jgi:hypothetical protein